MEEEEEGCGDQMAIPPAWKHGNSNLLWHSCTEFVWGVQAAVLVAVHFSSPPLLLSQVSDKLSINLTYPGPNGRRPHSKNYQEEMSAWNTSVLNAVLYRVASLLMSNSLKPVVNINLHAFS